MTDTSRWFSDKPNTSNSPRPKPKKVVIPITKKDAKGKVVCIATRELFK